MGLGTVGGAGLLVIIITTNEPLGDLVFSIPEILGSVGWSPKSNILTRGHSKGSPNYNP